jgi:hypothetical protein
MSSSQQIIRYSLPGALFVLVVVVFEYALHWAWSSQPNVVFATLAAHVVAAAASVLIIGFVTYQLYYLFYRPFMFLTWSKTATSDRGGTILKGLEGLEHDPLARITKVYNVPVDIGAPRSDPDRYKNAWHNHNTIVRSLVNTIADNGGVEIKRDYVNLSDIYHCLGACRLVSPLALLTTVIYAAASQLHAVEKARLEHMIWASAFICAVSFIVFYTCHMNRRHTWKTMTKQLQRDLRVWFVRQPAFLDPCFSSTVETPEG